MRIVLWEWTVSLMHLSCLTFGFKHSFCARIVHVVKYMRRCAVFFVFFLFFFLWWCVQTPPLALYLGRKPSWGDLVSLLGLLPSKFKRRGRQQEETGDRQRSSLTPKIWATLVRQNWQRETLYRWCQYISACVCVCVSIVNCWVITLQPITGQWDTITANNSFDSAKSYCAFFSAPAYLFSHMRNWPFKI